MCKSTLQAGSKAEWCCFPFPADDTLTSDLYVPFMVSRKIGVDASGISFGIGKYRIWIATLSKRIFSETYQGTGNSMRSDQRQRIVRFKSIF
jgi:hypothetical protein